MTYAELGIDTGGKSSGQIKTTCPQCSHTRNKKNSLCLSVNLGKNIFHCFHCKWGGSLKGQKSNGAKFNGAKQYSKRKSTDKKEAPKKATPIKIEYNPANKLSEKAIKWFEKRGIAHAVLSRNKIGEGLEYMPQTKKKENTIQFLYLAHGEVVNIKYRDGHKNFKMVKDAERTLYGHDDIQGETLIWTEGEIDKLSVEVAGYLSSVSVPNGANDNLDFLESCQEKLDSVHTHILAVDNDTPGKNLEAELIRRLGPEKCKVVKWPEGCKDANDVLVNHGVEKLRDCIEKAKSCPVSGLYSVFDLTESVLDLYDQGYRGGEEVEWPSMRKLYSVRPGEWTLVTGIPSHGKSEFVDALILWLAESVDWRFGVCSPENQPLDRHLAKLLEKRVRKPFREGPIERMNYSEMMGGLSWMDKRFEFILPQEDDLTVNGVLQLARALVFRNGIKGLVIDPWNELDHSRPSNLSETEYISQSLSKVRRFARNYGVHIWLVAHPIKMQKNSEGGYPVPTPYDVSGSAHWRNKADNCIAVWRDLSMPESRDVQIHVQKIRFKEIGKIGMAELEYDYPTGRYLDKSSLGKREGQDE